MVPADRFAPGLGSFPAGMARSAPSRQAARAAARRAERRAGERDRRRQDRLRQAARSQRATRRQLRLRRAPVRFLVGLVTLFLALVWSGAPEPFRQQHIPAVEPLTSYSVTYAVTYEGGVHNTEQITVQRPWYGKDVTYRGGRIVTAEMTNEQGLWDWSTNGKPGWFLLSQGLQRSESDAQPVLPLNWGIDRADAAVVGTGRVLGRPCTRVETGEPAGQPVAAPSGTSQAELCLDRTGVPLEEIWHLDGKLAEEMTAISFDPHFRPDPATFQPSPKVPTSGPPPVQAVSLTAAERTHIRPVLDPPPGFSLRTVYTSAQASNNGSGVPELTTKELYVGDGGLQVLELDYAAGGAPRSGIREQLGGGRVGYLSLDLYASALSIDIDGGASLVMYGPDPGLLLRAAKRLRG